MELIELSTPSGVPLDESISCFSRRLLSITGISIVSSSSTAGRTSTFIERYVDKAAAYEADKVSELIIDFSNFGTIARYGEVKVLLRLKGPVSAEIERDVERAFKNYYVGVLVAERTNFRERSIGKCLGAEDPSSLSKRIRDLTKEYVSAEGISVFNIDRAGNYLQLQSSTSYNDRVPKAAVKFWLDQGDDPIVRCINKARPFLFENGSNSGTTLQSFPERRYDVRNQYFFPIKLQKGIDSEHLPNVLGVVRLTNIRGSAAGEGRARVRSERALSWEDVYLLDFMMENYYLYYSGVFAVERSRRRFDRATHAIDISADASLHLARELKLELLGPDEDRMDHQSMPALRSDLVRLRTSGKISNNIMALEAYLEDLNEQILFNTGLEASFSTPFARDAIIDNFVNEVLRPIVRMAPRVAIIHQNSRTPRFNRLDDELKRELTAAKLKSVPKVYGSPKHFQSVFRNLLDNSIKYAPSERVNLRIDLKFTRDFAYVEFSDDGRGIPGVDVPRLFSEGFRGGKAWRISNKGLGIGLNASREILTYYGGTIRYVEGGRGARFEVGLPIAR